ncbi:vacuolar protein sorting-associated protein 41 homolog [Daphnia pulicaria]|uniref:vacuolar protein sorting-associated protein 41 homolog n=1 Tax=Daphnia pulicaria TaxID=35523 RepID=UPI001EEB3806|nr:vacuolar protein sorting-associated protein 41 homolog [Daphnia pulicaria]
MEETVSKLEQHDFVEQAAEMSHSFVADDDDEEEEVEPKLKYERLSNDITVILKKDAASCIAVHPKFMCLGTNWGALHLLDHLGHSSQQQEFPTHGMAINMVDIDSGGDYIGSCSNDGKVMVSGLYSTENCHTLMVDRPVKAIALDPLYYKSGSGRRFVTGDDRLILHEKVFLSRLKSTTLFEGEGEITNIKWKNRFLAWASTTGVRVFDMSVRRIISVVKKDISPGINPESYRCILYWKDDLTLVVAWADDIKVCVIRRRPDADAERLNLPTHYVEIVSMFIIDSFVAGAGWLGNHLALLVVPKDEELSGKGQRPQMKLVEPHQESYNEISADVLSIRGFQEYSCNEYHLECLAEEGQFFIVSPKDVVLAKPRNPDDHVQWLMEHQKYEEAMEAVTGPQARELKCHSVLQVGRTYLDFLLSKGEFQMAAKLCVKILGKEKNLWEEEVFKFARLHQLRAVTPYLPRGECRLDPHIYEMVLFEFLKTDSAGFLRLVREWSPTLYNIAAVMNAVLEHILRHDPDDTTLLEALAILYSHEKKYDRALAMYLKLQHADVFRLIAQHQLFTTVHDKILALMELDVNQACTLFLEHSEHIPSDLVVSRLQTKPQLLFKYLDALYLKEPKEGSRKFHGLLVSLYAEYAQEKLLSFLRSSDYYPIQDALDTCQQRGYIPEMIFLLARMGNTRDALRLIMGQLKDIDQAIEFCKTYDDPELWEQLIGYSLAKPEFVNVLLRNIGTHVDPRLLIQRIEYGVEVPGLRDSLVKILHDYNLQISLQEESQKILVSDCFSLHERLVRIHQRGMAIRDDQICGACHQKVIVSDPRKPTTGMVVFFCRHAFHTDCLNTVDTCPICYAMKLKPNAAISEKLRKP